MTNAVLVVVARVAEASSIDAPNRKRSAMLPEARENAAGTDLRLAALVQVVTGVAVPIHTHATLSHAGRRPSG